MCVSEEVYMEFVVEGVAVLGLEVNQREHERKKWRRYEESEVK